MRVEVLATEQLAAHGAAIIANSLRTAIAARGRATVAFSGGATARALLDALARTDVAWGAVEVLQVDERVAPDGHPDRNLTTLQQHLLDRVPLPADQVHPMPVTEPDLAAAAQRYADVLRRLAGCHPRLDLVHLGLGSDGHTASLTPGSALLDHPVGPVDVTEPYRGRRRMTLTLPVLSHARELLWLVRGAAKAPVVRRLVDGDTSIPAGRLPTAHARLLLDSAAAHDLSLETIPEEP
ncbi:MAG TPA: 6-phosphogluconolactonase [Acidimicrobiales bacterium]